MNAKSRKNQLSSITESLRKALDDKEYKIEIANKVANQEMVDGLRKISVNEKRAFIIPKTIYTTWIMTEVAECFEKRNGYATNSINGVIVHKGNVFSYHPGTNVRSLQQAIFEDSLEDGMHTMECEICFEDFVGREHKIVNSKCNCAGNMCFKCFLLRIIETLESETPLFLQCGYCRSAFMTPETFVKDMDAREVNHVLGALVSSRKAKPSIKNKELMNNLVYRCAHDCYRRNILDDDEAQLIDDTLKDLCVKKGFRLTAPCIEKPQEWYEKTYNKLMRSLATTYDDYKREMENKND
jgi:hypothetical protein